MSDGRLTFALANRRSDLPGLTESIDRFGRERRLSDDDLHDLHLILDELVINIIKYAYADERAHGIQVDLERRGQRLIVRVEDDGRPFDPLSAPPPDLDVPIERRGVGGLGIHIVRTLADSMRYVRQNGRNVLVVEKRLNAALRD
jgi:anti-sigma regulatory factor (Ser/Thr protein kinase)